MTCLKKPSRWLAFVIPLLLCSVCRGQLPAGWESQLDQNTVLVAGCPGEREMLQRVLTDVPDIAPVRLLLKTEAPAILIVTTSAMRLVVQDPEQKFDPLKADGEDPGHALQVRREGQLLVVEQFFPGSGASARIECSAEVRQRWAGQVSRHATSGCFAVFRLEGDFARVAREIFPAVIGELPGLDLWQWMEKLESAEAVLGSGPDKGLEVRFAMTDEAGALSLVQGIEPLRIAAARLPATLAVTPMVQQLLANAPQQEGSLVTLALGKDPSSSVEQFLDGLAARFSTIRAQDSIRQLVLAMHNFENSCQQFPGAVCGDGAKRGLSWRVAVLPYLGELELYRQFRMDEPWDSEHNRALIPKMPRIFLVPGSRLDCRDGRSGFAVPTGVGLAHRAGEECRLKDFGDGTSNTILVMALSDESAEIWTKPAAANFDSARPWEKLWKQPDGSTWTGMADGAVDVVPAGTPDDVICGLMTIDGGEVVELK